LPPVVQKSLKEGGVHIRVHRQGPAPFGGVAEVEWHGPVRYRISRSSIVGQAKYRGRPLRQELMDASERDLTALDASLVLQANRKYNLSQKAPLEIYISHTRGDVMNSVLW